MVASQPIDDVPRGEAEGRGDPAHLYAVSADGKVFTSQSWSPTKPNPKGISNLMYFDRQAGPEGSN